MIIEVKVTRLHVTADEWEIFDHHPGAQGVDGKPLYERGDEQRIEIASKMTTMLKEAINDPANEGDPGKIDEAWQDNVKAADFSKFGALDTEPRGMAWEIIEKVCNGQGVQL